MLAMVNTAEPEVSTLEVALSTRSPVSAERALATRQRGVAAYTSRMSEPGEAKAARRPILLYDGSCGFCRRSVALLVRLDPDHRVARVDMTSAAAEPLMSTISPARRQQSIHVIRPDGRVLHAGVALRAVLCQVQPEATWRSVGYWPLVGLLIDRAYDLVASLRSPLGRLTGWLPEPPPDDIRPTDWPLLERDSTRQTIDDDSQT